MKNEHWDYKIDGKTHGLARIVIIGLFSAIFIVLTVDQLQPAPGKYPQLAIGFGGFSVILLFTLSYLLIRYLYFKIYIGKDGFYFQTNPLNGTYYPYADIERAGEKVVVYRHRVRNGLDRKQYYHYFVFTVKNGKSQRVLFEKALYEREFHILQERIAAKAS